jgi:hypothetical protein
LVIVAVLTLPLASYPLGPGDENEYQAALTVAFREHLQWGSQIVWTYGPYGYTNVLGFMDFRTWYLALAANLIAHIAFFAALALFLIQTKARPWLWFIAGAIFLTTFHWYSGFDTERFPMLDHKLALTAVLLLFLATDVNGRRRRWLFAGIAGVFIAFLTLDKGTYVVIGGALVSVYVTINLVRRRASSVGVLLLSLVVSFLGFWMLAEQSPTGLPSYFRSLYELTIGYTPAMSWFNEPLAAHPMLQLSLGVAMLLALGACLPLALWHRHLSLANLLLLSVPVALFAYKNAFVRFDEPHALTFWSIASVLLGFALICAVATTTRPGARPVAWLAGGTVVAGVLLTNVLGPAIGGIPSFKPDPVTVQSDLSSYWHAATLLVRPDSRTLEERQVVARLESAYPLPQDVVATLRQGDVGVIPWDVQLAFAYDFKWNPQPVVLSYAAYTPYLDHEDALHFGGPRAPRFVIFAARDIDGRYPLFSEPETYRVVLERYQVLYRLTNMLVLEKRVPEPVARESDLGAANGSLGDWIAVPPHRPGPLFARVDVAFAPLGVALNLVDRPPELHIRLRYGQGQVSPGYRFVAAVAQDGLDLSTYAPDTASVGQVVDGDYGQPIDAIQILANGPVQAYNNLIRLTYFTENVA